MPISTIIGALDTAAAQGYRILKISGGGEPTLYPYLTIMLTHASLLGLKIYLQTNGSNLSTFIYRVCDDIRISFGDEKSFVKGKMKLSEFHPTGFSYVVTANPDYENLLTLLDYAVSHSLYVRITQDDTDIENVPSIGEIQQNIYPFKGDVINSGVEEQRRLDSPSLIRFWDAKSFGIGKNPCPSNSPLLGADGFWYPCCKTHCAKEVVKGYNETMRLGKVFPVQPFDGSNCKRCYY